MKKIIVFIFVIGTLLLFVPIFNVNAIESSGDYEDLFNETNNYNTKLTEKSETLSDGTVFNYCTNNIDFSNENGNQVSDEEPIVTFLTHGLGGDDYNWANIDLYGTNQYFENTIIDGILKCEEESDIYLFAFNVKSNDYVLKKYGYDICSNTYKWIDYDLSKESFNKNKHSIVIFDSSISSSSNDAVYFQFNIMISTVLKELKEQDINNRIPKINLIGHSRGGITNLQYALDHPDIVDSLISIGTPYFGSNSASIDFNLLFGMIAGGSGEADVANAEKYNEYYNRWNNNYETLYKNINAHALGGYSSCKAVISQLVYFCYKELTGKEIDKTHLSIVSNVINVYLNNLIYNIKEETITVEILNHIYNMIIKIVPELYNYTRFLDGILSLCDLFNDCLVFNYNEFEYDFKNDIIVDLSSQLAKNDETGQEYKGFNTYSKRYDLPSIDYTNVSTSTYPPVTHNIEAKDNDFIKYIIKNIKLSNQEKVDYLFQEIDNNSVAITGYIGDSTSDTLIIPGTIEYNGKTMNVTKINDGAFSNNCNGDSNIKNIIIPNTVTYIGENAFKDNEYLTSVTFEDGSLLEEIDEYAFSNIPNLLTFKIPSTCEVISNTAFRGSGILSFTGNSYYTWSNNFLVNNESKTAIYAKPNVTTFTVPSNVVSLGEYLFFNNKYVTSINMNNVSHIGMNCFTNSNVTNFTNITNVKKTDFESFVNTPWLENNESSEFLKFGNVLLAYNGTDTEVIVPEGIINISSNCFINNEICAIILPESTDYIGDYAFTFCDNLEWILFNSDNPPIINIDCFDEETILYVKDGFVTRYQEDLSFQFLSNTITTKSVNVKLYVDNTIYKTITETYCSNLDGFSNPSKTGYDFLYWLDSNGNMQKTGYIFKYYEDINLYAYFEKSKYTINLDNGDYTETITITYGEQVNLTIPNEDGYSFLGWYDSEIGGNLIIDSSGVCVWERTNEIENLYARFEVIEYYIYLYSIFGTFVGDLSIFEIKNNGYYIPFSVETCISSSQIPEIRYFGYVLEEWLYNDEKFVSTDGIYSDIRIEAVWFGTDVSPKVNGTTTINQEYSVVRMVGGMTGYKYDFLIPSYVDYVTFYGSGQTYSNMRIRVSSRNTRLVIGFDNISFYPTSADYSTDGTAAIECAGNFNLVITYSGTVRITGGAGGNGSSGTSYSNQASGNTKGANGGNGQNAGDGGNGITAYNVYLSALNSNSTITVKGGAGGIGGYGGKGQKGGDGVNSPSGSMFKPVAGDPGCAGGNGGDAGNGGNGGYAIYTTLSTGVNIATDSTYTLIGGAGGAGGNGGAGGAGGTGASDTSSNIFNGVGDPGDGGKGGNGGDGGNGGNGSKATNALYVYGTGGKKGNGGTGGAGGSGGTGGDAGAAGDDGKDGSTGINGTTGSSGLSGTTGVNTTGTSASIKEIPYVYDKYKLDQIIL